MFDRPNSTEIQKTIRLSIESQLNNISLVRASVHGLAERAGLPESDINIIEICVVEAVTNCIEHAYEAQPEHEIQIQWHLVPNKSLEMRVYDTGKAMPISYLTRANSALLEVDPDNPDSLCDGGRGLPLIKLSMDRVEYFSQEGRNCLVMGKDLGATQQHHPKN